MIRWLMAFLFTQVIECPLYLWALRRERGEGDEPKHSIPAALLMAFGATAVTHPFVWFVIPDVWRGIGNFWGHTGYIVAAETFAVVVEAWYLQGFGLRRAWLWALAANMASFGLGMLCRELWGFP